MLSILDSQYDKYLGVIFPSFEVEEVFFERFSGFGVCTLICDVGVFFVSGALVVLTVKCYGINCAECIQKGRKSNFTIKWHETLIG